MGFFESKTLDEKFKDKIDREEYSEAKAIMYSNQLGSDFIAEVVSSAHKKFIDGKDREKAEKIQEMFESYLMTPKERLLDKIKSKQYYDALVVVKEEKFSLKFLKKLVESTRENLINNDDKKMLTGYSILLKGTLRTGRNGKGS